MNKIEINIQLDPVNDGASFFPEKVVNKSKQGVVIGTNSEYRMVEEAEVYQILEQLGQVSDSDYMGKTSFLAVFNAKKVLSTGTSKFLVGSMLVVKGGRNGIELLNAEEVEKVKVEFESRLVTLCGSGTQFSAYELG